MSVDGKADNEPVTSKVEAVATKSAAEKIKFKWKQEIPKYEIKLLQRLNEFRKKNVFCDVTLNMTNGQLKAHSVILAACGGVFRTKLSNNSSTTSQEFDLACPVAGMKAILNFAYSGALEITSTNLLSVFLAATATEMKEIHEIASELCMARFGWLLEFNGAEDSLKLVTKKGRTNHKKEKSPTMEETFEFLRVILKMNLENTKGNNFSTSSCDNETGNGSSVGDDLQYPCACAVGKRWPDMKAAYVFVMQCLRKAAELEKSKNQPLQSSPEASNHIDTDSCEKKRDFKTEKKHDVNEVSTVSKIIVQPATAGDKPASDISTSRASEFSDTNELTSNKSQPPAPKVSTPHQVTSEAESPKIESENGGKKLEAPIVKVESSVNNTEPLNTTPTKPHSKSAPPIPSSPSPRAPSPAPPRRRKTTNKPPPPSVPPNPQRRSSSKSSSSNQVQEKLPTDHKTHQPKPVTKVPPPRPKPPSIQKMKKGENPTKNYDNSLNPFSDD